MPSLKAVVAISTREILNKGGGYNKACDESVSDPMQLKVNRGTSLTLDVIHLTFTSPSPTSLVSLSNLRSRATVALRSLVPFLIQTLHYLQTASCRR